MSFKKIFAGVDFEPKSSKDYIPMLSFAGERLESAKESLIISDVARDIKKDFKRIVQWTGYLSSIESMVQQLESGSKFDGTSLSLIRGRMEAIDAGMGLSSRTTNRVLAFECFNENIESNLVIAKESMLSKLKAGAKFIIDKIIQFFKWVFRFLTESRKTVSVRAKHTSNQIKKAPKTKEGEVPINMYENTFTEKIVDSDDIREVFSSLNGLMGALIALTGNISDNLDGQYENIVQDHDLRSLTNQWDEHLENAIRFGEESRVASFNVKMRITDIVDLSVGNKKSAQQAFTFRLNPIELEDVVNEAASEEQRIGNEFGIRRFNEVSNKLQAKANEVENPRQANLTKVGSYLTASVTLFELYNRCINEVFDFCDTVIMRYDEKLAREAKEYRKPDEAEGV